MKPYIVGIALMFTVACNSFKPFTFVQMSDTQIGFIDKSPQYTHSDSLMKAAVEATNALCPAYVFITGDLVDNPADPVQDSVYRALTTWVSRGRSRKHILRSVDMTGSHSGTEAAHSSGWTPTVSRMA